MNFRVLWHTPKSQCIMFSYPHISERIDKEICRTFITKNNIQRSTIWSGTANLTFLDRNEIRLLYMNSKNEYVVIINQCQAYPTIAIRSHSLWVVGSWKKALKIDMSTTRARQSCIKSEMTWWTEKCFLLIRSDSYSNIYPLKKITPTKIPNKNLPPNEIPHEENQILEADYFYLCTCSNTSVVFLTGVEFTATSRWNCGSHRITEVNQLKKLVEELLIERWSNTQHLRQAIVLFCFKWHH